jgi:membrane protein implicated in regulation of membrane protease activity
MLVPDALSAVYLVCFLFGLVMVVLAALSGLGHISLHLGHLHLHGVGHGGGHGAHGAGGNGAGHAHAADTASPFNAMSVLVFLTWFGGVGYLLHGPLGVWGGVSALVALLAGLVGAALVFQFLARVLIPQSRPLDPADYALEGQVGQVSSPIRADGVGEVLYSQRGRRRVIGARAADGAPLPRGTEVVIVTVEHGLALVQPWEQFVSRRAGGPPEQPARTVAMDGTAMAQPSRKEQQP